MAPAAVTTLRVCPVVAPSPFNKPATAVTLPVGDPRFTDLLRALSLPDLPRAKGMMCPLYADLVQPVLARTASTAILVHLPVDGCDHVLSSVRSALAVVVNA
ncbi:MAG TPA: hypothetical protein VHE57_07700 [Mycobacteriales bacterium]|nr:hypothetical protein [Mycobacteriales bacterium]